MIISESERRSIQALYEQTQEVSAFKLDKDNMNRINDSDLDGLEKEFMKQYANSKAKQYIEDNLNFKVDEDKPLSFLSDNGITPYVYLIPNFATGRPTPTTGVNFKVKNTPFNFSLNLGTDPKEIFNSVKWSQIGLNVKF